MAMNIGLVTTLAFFVTTLFMLTLRPVAQHVGLIDLPGGRKSHEGAVPLIGGMAMFMGLCFSLPWVIALDVSVGFFLIAVCLLLLIGLIDDRFELAPAVRLIGQTCATLIAAFGAGMLVHHLGNAFFFGDLGLGPFSLIFTVLVVLTVVNAFNMVDGMDGLAASMGLVSLLASALVGWGTTLAELAVALVAVLAAFLLFNLPIRSTRRLRAFMGDAGSTFLGFAVAFVGIRLSQDAASPVPPVVVLWFTALPLFDLFSSMARRMAKGRSPFAPDAEHIHHILQRAGFSPRRSLAILVLLGTAYALVGLLGYYLAVPEGVLFLAWAGTGTLQYLLLRRAWRVAGLLRAGRRLGAHRVDA